MKLHSNQLLTAALFIKEYPLNLNTPWTGGISAVQGVKF